MTEFDPSSYGFDDHDEVELRLGADLVHLPVVRSVAANIATRADFDLDTIADLRLAIDEACSALISSALPGSRMTCFFSLVGGEFRFTGRVDSTIDGPPSSGSFGWRVLLTLADSASTWLGAGERADGQYLHIQLTKQRMAVAG